MRSAIKGTLAGAKSLFAKMALLCAAMIVLMVPCSALALSEGDTASNAQLTVYAKYGEELVPNVNVDIYHVGDIDENGAVVPTDAFASYDVLWDVSTSGSCQALANALEAYVLRDSVVPTSSAVTNEQGVAVLPPDASQSLATGLYLVVAQHVSDAADAFEIAPMLLMLGAEEGGQTAVLKMSKPPVEEFVTIDVFKVWKNAGPNDTTKIEATLLRDGEVYETVVLSKDNSWHYAWKNLPAAHEWDVIERVVPEGFKVSIVKDGNSFTLINTGPGEEEPPPPPPLPQTGGMWWPVLILLAVGVVLFAFGVARRSRG